MQTLSVKTDRRTQLVDVTAQVQKVVASSGVSNGICYLYVPHTTAAITINECADPDVARDVEGVLDRLVPSGGAVPTQRRQFGLPRKVHSCGGESSHSRRRRQAGAGMLAGRFLLRV